MKHLLSIVFVFVLAATSKAKENFRGSDVLKISQGALIDQKAEQIISFGNYPETLRLFGNKNIRAYYDKDKKEILGFILTIPVDNLPEELKKKLEERFDGYILTDISLFIRQQGEVRVYTSLSPRDKSKILLNTNDYEINDYGE